ncbi:hypothetical protein, partial [Oscillibacter sp. CAG:155]|uniref:hypothetical protein n=1 Tax=Oscillibacter sp. CAG:155 TaxID=1262910 RepID=UPI00263F96A0
AAAAWGCTFPPSGGSSHRYQMNTNDLTPFSYHTNQSIQIFQPEKNFQILRKKGPPEGGPIGWFFISSNLSFSGRRFGHSLNPGRPGSSWQYRPPA